MADGDPVDLLVVGGGVNGTGIARDAAGRGLAVVLAEQDDLAEHTSSRSSKLIHGGLRYLEHREFRLVRAALSEREVLLRAAPHIIRPLRFVLPHSPEQRPAWLIWLGLFLYDHLGGRERLPRSRRIDLGRDPAGAPLKAQFRRGFSYADCWVDDARLVVLNAVDAAARGAEILPRTRCVAARRTGGLWYAELRPRAGGPERVVRARALVNAAGPFVSRFMTEALRMPPLERMRLVKGSHIVVPRLFDHPSAYILQHTDGRVVFVIPYERRFSLIGTTDVDFAGDPATVAVTDEEVRYLCAAVGRYFRRRVAPEDVVWQYAGVRPLYDDAGSEVSAVTRDYALDLDAGDGIAPLLSVFGGKITTYRRLAEDALARLQPVLGFGAGPWTGDAHLPGGDIANADFDAFLADLKARHDWLPAPLAERYGRAYGTCAERLLGDAISLAGLGEHLGDDLYEAEVDHLVQNEWAVSADDILWRRSKLGLHVGDATAARLRAWLERTAPAAVAGGRA